MTKAEIHARHLARIAAKAAQTHGHSKQGKTKSGGGPHAPEAPGSQLSSKLEAWAHKKAGASTSNPQDSAALDAKLMQWVKKKAKPY